ncbi:hypothetical protein C0J52_25541 [Blattella germanica]|nr:hypothetical protein C0J52_25541 [Blattella germanica]
MVRKEIKSLSMSPKTGITADKKTEVGNDRNYTYEDQNTRPAESHPQLTYASVAQWKNPESGEEKNTPELQAAERRAWVYIGRLHHTRNDSTPPKEIKRDEGNRM